MGKLLCAVSAVLTITMLLPSAASADTATEMRLLGDRINAALMEAGAPYELGLIEWLTDLGGDEAGQTVFFNNRGNRQLAFDFVPGDPRRDWNPSFGDITYLVDQSDGDTTTLTNAETEPAIDRAMTTWDFATQCSNTPIVKVADNGDDPDLVDGIFGFGGIGTPFADITHAGWTSFFPPPTLGVTFTFRFIDGSGNSTDINNDGKFDTAFREIYYSDNFIWRINGNIDVETVALHEAGHGLSQAHYGSLFRTEANGEFHFAPRAVMNAGYTGPQQQLTGTDLAGHCSIWGNWPNN